MVRTEGVERIRRNAYLRYITNMLMDTYLVSQPKLASALGMRTEYVRDFALEIRNIRHTNLNKFEDLFFDLFEPILVHELPETIEEVEALIDIILRDAK